MGMQHGKQESRVVERFEADDLGAPFKVVLVDSVPAIINTQTGEIESYSIPHPDGLLRAVVLARILTPRKLSGAEVKFLRKAVGVRQNVAAQGIEVGPEHLSRCEAGSQVLSPGTEKLLRLFLFKTVIKHHRMPDTKAKKELEVSLDALFDHIKPVAAFAAADELVLEFKAVVATGIGNDNDVEPWTSANLQVSRAA